MTRFTVIDKKTAKKVGEQIVAELQELAKELGVEIRSRGGSFSAGNATFKIEVALVKEDGSVATPEADNFVVMARQYGLHEDDLGRTFYAQGQEFKITGLRPRATKRPICCEGLTDGKTYVFDDKSVVAGLLAEDAKGK